MSSPGSQGRAGEGAGANHGPAVTKTLCLGQVDSAHERVVKREDGEKLAKVSQGRGVVRGCPWRPRAWAVPARPPPGSSCLQEYGLPFMETSAKTGLNVDLAFTAIAK